MSWERSTSRASIVMEIGRVIIRYALLHVLMSCEQDFAEEVIVALSIVRPEYGTVLRISLDNLTTTLLLVL